MGKMINDYKILHVKYEYMISLGISMHRKKHNFKMSQGPVAGICG
jgi:hypothetical protein